MFAVIRTGGKQYKVAPGDVIKVEQIAAEKGETVGLDDVLLGSDGTSVRVGTPTLTDLKVQAEVLDQIRDKKVIIFKKRRRQSSQTKNGHRQNLTVLRITAVGSAKAEAKKPAAAPQVKPAKAAVSAKKSATEKKVPVKAAAPKADPKKAPVKKAEASPKKAPAKKTEKK
ncbi:MAG: 50S ribosomal protein L21 [bacterium]|nr:50S ribosomal protein L21 [bacterium]